MSDLRFTLVEATPKAADDLSAIKPTVKARRLLTDAFDDPIYVQARVWGSPAHLTPAHAAALGGLCSEENAVISLQIGMVTAPGQFPARAETRVAILMTVAAFDVPDPALTWQDKCKRRVADVVELIQSTLRAYDPTPPPGCKSARWSPVPDDVRLTPVGLGAIW